MAFDITQNAPALASTLDYPRYDVATDIQEENWNKYFPYQLAVLEATGNGYRLVDEFTLPIPPEDLSVMMPFAINSSATIEGIVEQHGGAPFRMISFSGTTGVINERADAAGQGPFSALGQIGAIFGGTIEAAQRTVESAKNTLAIATGAPTRKKNLYTDSDIQGDLKHRTGYYQFRVLQRFLESYVEVKKTADGKNYRLALMFWKDQACYLVTPQQFEVRRNANSPMEYRYSLSFKAWRRIDPDSLGNVETSVSTIAQSGRRPAILNNIKNLINGSRATIRAAEKTLRAIYGDFDTNIADPMRQVTLAIKDINGLVKTAYDFPKSFAQHAQDEWAKNWDIIKDGIQSSDPTVDQFKKKMQQRADDYKNGRTPPRITEDFPAEFLDAIPASMASSAEARRLVDEETSKAQSLTRADFDQMRGDMLARIADFSDRVGLGDPTMNAILGRTASPKLRDATDEDVRILFSLSQTAECYARLAAYEPTPTTTNLEYVAGLAAASGIDFRVPRSKFAVPFPYGSTLEQLAARYLRDPTRWYEIAALNELREPYVDEEGFDVPLVGNGDGHVVPVGSVTNLYIGQSVTLYSSTVTPFKRRIVNLKRVRDGYWLVTLDGTDDLGRLQKDESATLHAFLPATVNSQQLVYIPSDRPAEEQEQVPTVPGVSDVDALLASGGIDLLLTQDGDLAITPDGDCRVAAGLTNIVQRVRVALATPQGSMLLHPEFGIDIEPGTSNADVSAQDLLQAAKMMFKGDSAISGVVAASVDVNGPVTKLSVEVRARGADITLPISIDVRT